MNFIRLIAFFYYYYYFLYLKQGWHCQRFFHFYWSGRSVDERAEPRKRGQTVIEQSSTSSRLLSWEKAVSLGKHGPISLLSFQTGNIGAVKPLSKSKKGFLSSSFDKGGQELEDQRFIEEVLMCLLFTTFGKSFLLILKKSSAWQVPSGED